ncbi:MAG: hypothetical protein AB8G96_13085 [Phycisphaerales bacterium]
MAVARSMSKNLPILFGITLVTVLIWTWATGATRVAREVPITIVFEVSDPDGGRWRVSPAQRELQVQAEGSRIAINQLGSLTSTVTVKLAPTEGRQDVSLTNELARDPSFRRAGLLVQPVGATNIEVHAFERIRRRVEDVEIHARATGETLRLHDVADLRREVVAEERWVEFDAADDSEPLRDTAITLLARPESGGSWDVPIGESVIRAPTRLTIKGYPEIEDLTFDPPQLFVDFTVMPDDETYEARNVRVHVMYGPDEDIRVVLDPPRFERVRIKGPPDLLARLRDNSGDAMLIGVLHLRSIELGLAQSTKQLSGFAVMDNRPGARSGSIIPVLGEVYATAAQSEPDSGLPNVTYSIIKPAAPTPDDAPEG